MTNYDDIINLSRPLSDRPKMSRYDRAAQFSPFAALTGYEDAVDETARLTDCKLEPDDDRISDINEKLRYIYENIYSLPEIELIYFVQDMKKNGGKYISISGKVRLVEEYENTLIFKDGRKIPISDIYEIKILERSTKR